MQAARRTHKLFQLLRRLPKTIATEGSPESVHQFRTTIRRVETLLARLPSAGGARKLRKRLAKLRRPAGKVRDMDVQIAALRTVHIESAVRDKAQLLRRLSALRAKKHNRLVTTVEDHINGRFRKLTRVTESQLAQSKSTGRGLPHQALREALELFARIAQPGRHPTAENLHQFRLQCKRVRYQIEAGGDGALADAALKELKRVQDAIGEWHDWTSLVASADRMLGRTRTSPLLPALQTTTQTKFLEAIRVVEDSSERLLALRAKLSTRKPPRPESAPLVKHLATSAS